MVDAGTLKHWAYLNLSFVETGAVENFFKQLGFTCQQMGMVRVTLFFSRIGCILNVLKSALFLAVLQSKTTFRNQHGPQESRASSGPDTWTNFCQTEGQ